MVTTMRTEGVLSWDETFMAIAKIIAKRSKDPSTQNGAVIVNSMNVILGSGYNGWPRGIDNDALPWDKGGAFLDNKYTYVVHAEENAIYNAPLSIRGARIYTPLFPCNECAKAIIQTGIAEVVYEQFRNDEIFKAAKRLFHLARVATRQFPTPNVI